MSQESTAVRSSEEERTEDSRATARGPERRTKPDESPAIRVQNVSKCYLIYDKPQDRLKQSLYPRMQRLAGLAPRTYCREFWALRDVSFEVKKGETVGIIGRNGSGKSTLLQMICGTLTPTSGTVETQGRVAALLELGAGFNPEFTGRENVYMNGALLGLSKNQIDARFEDIAAFADIGDFIEQPVKRYSSGMFVRLAFAVQVCVDPDILVIDEALAVGDASFVHKCFHRLRTLRERGVTFLFVTHDTGAITSLCEQALLLDHGAALMLGNAESVVNRYNQLIRTRQMHEEVTTRLLTHVPTAVLSDAHSSTSARRGPVVGDPLQQERFAENRFGSGRVRFLQAVMEDISGNARDTFSSGQPVYLRLTLEILEDVLDLNVGYQIRSSKGDKVLGSYTLLEGMQFPSCRPGTILCCSFFTYLRLRSGSYSTSIACSGVPRGCSYRETADWIDLAYVFSVYFSNDQTSYEHFVHLPNEIGIEVLSNT